MASIGRHPVSALHEYCNYHRIPLPQFKELEKKGTAHNPLFSFHLHVCNELYGPAYGSSKSDAKANVAILACDALKLEHSGEISKVITKDPNRNSISKLYEFCQCKQWPKPKDTIVKEEGPAHDKYFAIQYRIAEKNFPIGVGKNKDSARRRAAARALSELKNEKLREHIRGPDPDEPFGKQIAEFAWEAFGILCEEMNETPEFCQASNLACFILENHEDGSLKVVSIGTGSQVADEKWRVMNGETIIDSHAIVIARRALLVFLYDQLTRLLHLEKSIFEFSSPSVAALKENYEFHLYIKEPPCGDASFKSKEKESLEDVKDNHSDYFNPKDGLGKVSCKKEAKDIVSCSDKLLLWNSVGLQGSLLSKFIPPIHISSITVSNYYSPKHLTRSMCCRLNDGSVEHPWFQCGSIKGIQGILSNKDWRKRWSIYWTHAKLDLSEDLQDMPQNAGIIDATTGCHIKGSDRYGEIPIICKRNILRKYRTLCQSTGAYFDEQLTYLDMKNKSTSYKLQKNEFFKTLDDTRRGTFPIMNRQVDMFRLLPEDLKES